MHVDDTWPSVHLTVTDLVNKAQWPSCHLYLALNLAAVTNVTLALDTDGREVSAQFWLLYLNTVGLLKRRPTADCIWNVMAHAQKPDFVFRRNGRVHLNQRGRQFSQLVAGEVCVSAVVMLDASCSEVVWRVLTTHSIRQFPLHFPSRASPCAITYQLDSTSSDNCGCWASGRTAGRYETHGRPPSA